MLLSHFKQTVEIDKDIEQLHQELSRLYKHRRDIIHNQHPEPGMVYSSASAQPTIVLHSSQVAQSSSRLWEEEQYDKQVALWSGYELAVPEYKKLADKLTKAKHTINELLLHGDNFELLLVPPIKEVNMRHSLIGANSIVLGEGLKDKADKTQEWKLYVVAADPLCYPIKTASEFAACKAMTLYGYRMPGLNVREYAVFLATHEGIVDQDSWSLLLRNVDGKAKLVPCVARVGGNYQFETDYTEVLVGDNHFRPAMEVN